MSATKILIDCDPGIDDALAIALAAGHPELEIIGVTTVGGNVDLDKTTANALKLREFLGMAEVPVAAGSPDALLRPRTNAAAVHGSSGLGDARLPEPRLPLADGHAVDLIIETLAAAPGAVTLVAIGPLTNIALALRREPRVVEWAGDIVIMGGSYTRGNTTPAAEFNILVDPEAAAIVFAAGWTVTMVGLDLTLQARATTTVVDRMRGLGRLTDDLLMPCLEFAGMAQFGDGPPIHDACALAYVARSELMECVPAEVNVETVGRYTSGMTVTDFRTKRPNAIVPTKLDVAGFWELTISAYERLAARLDGRGPSVSRSVSPALADRPPDDRSGHYFLSD